MAASAETRFLQIQDTYQQLVAKRKALAYLKAEEVFAVGVTIDFGYGLTPVKVEGRELALSILPAAKQKLEAEVERLEVQFASYGL